MCKCVSIRVINTMYRNIIFFVEHRCLKLLFEAFLQHDFDYVAVPHYLSRISDYFIRIFCQNT